jgi:hypothetical protein
VKFHYHDHFLQLLYSLTVSITAQSESAGFSDSVKSLSLDQEQVPCAAVNLSWNAPFAIKSLNHDTRIFTAALWDYITFQSVCRGQVFSLVEVS